MYKNKSHRHLHDPQTNKEKDSKPIKEKKKKCSFYDNDSSTKCNSYALKEEIYCAFHYTLNIEIENAKKYTEMIEALSNLNMKEISL